MNELKEAKELFISIAAHKLLAPLVLIKWNVELLERDRSLSDNSREKINDIYESINKLDKFSNVLLKIVQEKSDSSEEKRHRSQLIDIKKVLADVEKTLKFEITKKNITPGSVNLPITESDFFYLLYSLLDNSLQYNVNTDKKIEFDIVVEKGFLRVSVKDNGISIPKAEVSMIGEAFFRTSNSQTLSVKGFGLSLYLCKLILGNVRGLLQVKSTETDNESRSGSEFEVIIPVSTRVGVNI